MKNQENTNTNNKRANKKDSNGSIEKNKKQIHSEKIRADHADNIYE